MTVAIQQLSLMPVDVDNLLPKHDESADCQTYCEGIDGHRYAVKQVSDNPALPFTPFDELFCYELARLCSIAVPPYNVLKMPSGELAFGSTWEGGLLSGGLISILKNYEEGGSEVIPTEKLIRHLSAIYAFDLFVHNDDRHFGNYLVRSTHKSYVMLAMDFSRSWNNLNCPVDLSLKIMSPPMLPTIYMSPPHHESNAGNNSNTYIHAKIIWSIFNQINGGSFFNTLIKLEQITVNVIENILQRVPDEWCSEDRKRAIIRWWDSEFRYKRINKIKGAYQNGILV
ncbi:HipA family kinase [Marinobacterium jannaschii]|uniref:HipA family kinase n=1 Tax=Marinobacterium jannaschii TaxID=64970 RepID=UPI000A3E03F1|nr:HipA family kinase [Marinobacterium jannaschii]